MLKIWGRMNSINVQKVMWTVGELGLEHERVDVGGEHGRLDTPAYGAMNPNRRVPTIQDGSFTLWESNVIVRYLAAKHHTRGLWPVGPETRAIAEQWMDWQQTMLLPDMRTVFWGLIRTEPGATAITRLVSSERLRETSRLGMSDSSAVLRTKRT